MRTTLPPKHRILPPQAKLAFQGEIFAIYQWEQELYDGSKAIFEMAKRADTVQVIAIKEDKLIILREQQPSMPPLYSVPGGRHDEDSETELEAAQRELREETGMSFKNWRLVKVYQPQLKIDWFSYYFLATDYEGQTETRLDPGEKIEVHEMSLSEVQEVMATPEARHLPADIFAGLSSLDELKNLPEYEGIKIA